MIPLWLDSKFDNILPAADISRKLLPKFLDSSNPEDWKKAEKIIESITAIEWKEMPEELRKGFFGKEKEAKTLVDSHWLLEAFKMNATKVGERCSDNVIFTIADRLKDIFRRENPFHRCDITYQSNRFWIVVKHLHDFEFNGSVYLVKGIDTIEKDVAAQLGTGAQLDMEKVLPDFSIPDCRNKESFIASLRTKLKENPLFEKNNNELDREFGIFYEGIFSDYSDIWFGSLFSEPGLRIHGAKETLTLILRDITLAKALTDKTVGHKIFIEFLGEKYQDLLFKRIVLFVIGKEWELYNETFWQMIENEDVELFDKPYLESELYVLLQENVAEFTSKEKEKIKTIIEKGTQENLTEEQREKYLPYWKQRWYSALKSDSFFKLLYEEQKKITGIEEKPPHKGIEVVFREGHASSPLSKEDILKLPNAELSEFLNAFKTKDRWEGPTIDGLSNVLKESVQEKHEKFTEDLTPFLHVGYLYVYYILWGLKDAWNQKQPIAWGQVFDFIQHYIDREEFWKDKFKIEGDVLEANHRWIVGVIGELIQEGTKDDEWAFSESHIPVAQKILFSVLSELKTEDRQNNDTVTHALNSPEGKIITAMIYLALRIARIEEKKGIKKEPKWSSEIKDWYEEIIKSGIIEGYTLLGQYMPNLYYLDQAWVKNKIQEISPEKNINLWVAFMEGYLFSGRLHDDLYKLMKNHYIKALEHVFKEKYTNQRLVEHISLQYLNGKEAMDDPEGLFMKLIYRWNPSQIEEIIGFFWGERADLGEKAGPLLQEKSPELQKMTGRIIEFWRFIYGNKYSRKKPDELTKDDKDILGYLSKLTIFLPKIDEEKFNWLNTSAPYVNISVGFNAPFFIEYLDILKDKDQDTTHFVGEVYLKMLEGSTPDFDKKHIRSIVEYLYVSGEKVNADKICNIYGLRGLDFLRDLYEKYQQKITQ